MTDFETITPENRETAAAWVLGALPELEAQAFQRQMMREPALRLYVDHISVAADSLLKDVEQIEPPRGLKRAVMTEARREIAPAKALARRPRRSTGWAPLRPAVALAAAASLALGGFLFGQSTGGEPARLATVPVEAEAAIGSGGTVTMIGGGRNGAMVRLHGLPKLERGRVYQLWIERANGVEPSTTFTVSQNGRATAAVGDDIGDAKSLMVTEEKLGGSHVPTTPVLVIAKMS